LLTLLQVEASCKEAAKAKNGINSLTVLNLPLYATQAQPEQGAAAAASQPGPGAALKLSASEKEAALASMVEQGWLFGDDQEGFRVGPRSFLELSAFLLEQAEEEVEEVWKEYV